MSHYVFIILTGADLQRPAEADGFQYMAAADGMKLGKAISLSQSGGYAPSPLSFARMNKAAADGAEASMPVMAGELEITAAVNAVFELLN